MKSVIDPKDASEAWNSSQRKQGDVSTLRFIGVALPRSQYQNFMPLTPGVNCNDRFGHHGDFFVSISYFVRGKYQGASHHPLCTAEEVKFINLDAMPLPEAAQHEFTLLEVQYFHASTVPVELYTSHTDRRDQSYLSYTAHLVMGDELYNDYHSNNLENCLFSSGIASSDTVETGILVANPYYRNIRFSIVLYDEQRRRRQSAELKLHPMTAELFRFEEIFAHLKGMPHAMLAGSSFCVCGQYKMAPYVTILSRKNGALESVDHLHHYNLL